MHREVVLKKWIYTQTNLAIYDIPNLVESDISTTLEGDVAKKVLSLS